MSKQSIVRITKEDDENTIENTAAINVLDILCNNWARNVYGYSIR